MLQDIRKAWTGVIFLLLSPLLFAHGSSCKLTLVEAPLIIIDPACATCDDSGTAVFQLRNDNSNPVNLHLTVAELINTSTNKPTHVQITPAILRVVAADGGPAKKEGTVAPGGSVFLQIQVHGLLEEGEWQAQIHNQGTNLGAFKVLKYHLPLGIKLDAPKPDDPELSFERRQPKVIILRNSDPISYPLCWSLFVDGRISEKANAQEPCSKVVVPAKGVARINLDHAPEEWFAGYRFEGFLKDQTGQGHLVLSFGRGLPAIPTGDSSATILPFRANMAYYGKICQQWGQATIVLATLFLGALFSVVLGAWIPNLLARVQIKRQLESLHREVRELSLKLSSRVRVPVGVEAGRLSALIAARGALRWAQFAAATTEVAQAMERLQKRVGLIQELGEKRERFERLLEHILFPSLTEETETKFEEAIEALRKTEFADSDLLKASNALQEIGTRLKSLAEGDRSNLQRPQILANRTTILERELSTIHRPHDRDGLPDFFKQLWHQFDKIPTNPTNPAFFEPALFPQLDLLLAQMEILKDFLNYSHANPGSAEPQKLLEKLVQYLRQGTRKGFQAARLLADEMRDGFFKQDLEKEIAEDAKANTPDTELYYPAKTRFFRWLTRDLPLKRLRMRRIDSTALDSTAPEGPKIVGKNHEGLRIDGRKLEIRLLSSEVRPFQPIYFQLSFNKEVLNEAAAKQEYLPYWNFHHDDLTPETGWEVTHYFPKAQPYLITVTLHHKEQGLVRQEGQPFYAEKILCAYEKKGPGQSGFWLTIVQLLAILFLAALGLFTGAKEQFLKLDTVPALITIFMMGFSSDRVKSLLAQPSGGDKAGAAKG